MLEIVMAMSFTPKDAESCFHYGMTHLHSA
jgi:hypothetical protein